MSSQVSVEILTALLSEAMTLLDAKRGYILYRDADTGALDVQAAEGFNIEWWLDKDVNLDEFFAKGEGLGVKSSASLHDQALNHLFIQQVAKTGSLLTTNAAFDQEHHLWHPGVLVAYGLRSILCVALNSGGAMAGMLFLDKPLKRGPLRDADVASVKALIAQHLP